MLMLAFACWGPPTTARAGLCAASSVYLDFRAAKETSVGKRETLLCGWRGGTLPGNLPRRAQRGPTLNSAAGLGRAVCALVCCLGSWRMSPFCLIAAALSSQSSHGERAQPTSWDARENQFQGLVTRPFSESPCGSPEAVFLGRKVQEPKHP